MPKKKSKFIKCERCDTTFAVIVYEYNYYCADCALFELNIPFKKAISIEDANLSRKKQ
jgi:Zn finger protein HypA/HybF involved in hydrogenase expression|tara:strand:+ start:3050 stop:3223 length:174 start_codon:yes stop_codon:yes gene_type:complete